MASPATTALIPLLPGQLHGNRGPEAWGAQIGSCCPAPCDCTGASGGGGTGPTGPTGPTGSSGPATEEEIILPFSFAPPLVTVIAPLLATDIVVSSSVQVLTPFDDPAATASLGTIANPVLLLAPINIDLTTIAQYQNGEMTTSPPDQLQLVIVPGASTTGNGRVLVRIHH